MMATFFAQRVILGKADFKASYGEPGFIPSSLKLPVSKVLLENGLFELVPVAYGGTQA